MCVDICKICAIDEGICTKNGKIFKWEKRLIRLGCHGDKFDCRGDDSGRYCGCGDECGCCGDDCGCYGDDCGCSADESHAFLVDA